MAGYFDFTCSRCSPSAIASRCLVTCPRPLYQYRTAPSERVARYRPLCSRPAPPLPPFSPGTIIRLPLLAPPASSPPAPAPPAAPPQTAQHWTKGPKGKPVPHPLPLPSRPSRRSRVPRHPAPPPSSPHCLRSCLAVA
eukprot:2438126-Rhodomonas_salina.1